MSEIIFQGNYSDFKLQMDIEIKEAAEGFVRIGYLLKVARDTNVLYESGYKSVSEFAKAEYGLSQAYRLRGTYGIRKDRTCT